MNKKNEPIYKLQEELRIEYYPKGCVLQYDDGWYITWESLGGNIIKSHGPYRTEAMAEPDREVLNSQQNKRNDR